MDRLTLLETLKSKSMTLSFEDIQGIMDEELNKNPEEMDAELIDLCADVLDNAYFGTQDEVITLENKTIQKYIPILHYSIKTNEYKESKFIFITANEYETVVF